MTRAEWDRVWVGERFSVSFQRTLRIPDDGREYPLPPGLGAFRIHRVEDFVDRVPAAWRELGGVFIPMYQREALWLSFDAAWRKPNAVKVGIGRVNAVSGEPWSDELHTVPQDYIVCPEQPWLDGINAGDGFIRQFVAMPLGQGYTVEAQLTGAEEHGGIQLLVYEPKPGCFPDEPPEPDYTDGIVYSSLVMESASPMEMGFGAGGKMRQSIYPDSYGVETWDQAAMATLFVHIVNSEQYREVTGEEPPESPVDAAMYSRYGYPWFALYDEPNGDVAASTKLTGIASIKDIEREQGVAPHSGDDPLEINPSQVVQLPHDKVKKAST